MLCISALGLSLSLFAPQATAAQTTVSVRWSPVTTEKTRIRQRLNRIMPGRRRSNLSRRSSSHPGWPGPWRHRAL